jgi:hypothetical protein
MLGYLPFSDRLTDIPIVKLFDIFFYQCDNYSKFFSRLTVLTRVAVKLEEEICKILSISLTIRHTLHGLPAD